MSLLIVESPAKGRKIQKFLHGTGITVTSSFGHINNLDTEKLDAMITNNFTPIYKLSKDKAKVIKELTSLGKGKDIILAADDDREGDAIAWHCGNLFKTDFTKFTNLFSCVSVSYSPKSGSVSESISIMVFASKTLPLSSSISTGSS